MKNGKYKLTDKDQYRLDDAYGRLAEAQQVVDVLQENIALKARNAELEEWYASYCQAGHDRLASDLSLSIGFLKSQLPA